MTTISADAPRTDEVTAHSEMLRLQELSREQSAEIARLRADAERYRWLANDCDGDGQDDFIRWLSGHVASRHDIDAAIDAAMAQRAKG